MKKIEMNIQCPSCGGTGIYVGMAERDGAAVVCNKCNGSGEYLYVYEYTEFTGKKIKENVSRVYKNSYGYIIAPYIINFKRFGEIDMSKEGISYKDFLEGKIPDHTKSISCPMLADQRSCHAIDRFVKRCESKNGGYFNYIPDCKFMKNKEQCWKIFDEAKVKINNNL